MKIARLYFVILFVFLVSNVSAYCYDDIYGDWESLSGISININSARLKIEGGCNTMLYNKNKSLIGYGGAEYDGVELSKYIGMYSKIRENNYFKCRVVEINRQIMIVEPTSDLARKILGVKRICLFNNNFISDNEIRIDSFYYSRSSIQYELLVSNNGNARLVNYGVNYMGRPKKKIYEGKIEDEKLTELKSLLIKSRIFLLSDCEWKSSCSCCLPVNLGIYFNGYFKRYQGSDNSVIYEIDDWSKLVRDSVNWQRVNKN